MTTGPNYSPGLNSKAAPIAALALGNIAYDRWMLKSIPGELLKKILSFADIASLVIFASCSSQYKIYVYRESSWLWQDIDFAKVSQANRLTDSSLLTLLTNVNAVNVTTTLSLMGCTSVRGYGLGALSGSSVMEQVELRQRQEEITSFGSTGLDDKFVTSVLSTMSPINALNRNGSAGLKIVKFRKQYNRTENFYSRFSDDIAAFLMKLHESIRRQVDDCKVSCHCCKEALVKKIPEEYFDWKAATCYCSECKRFKCGSDNCDEVDIPECSMCMDQICKGCGGAFLCEDCNLSFCERCRFTYFCGSCKTVLCDHCRDPLYCEFCDYHYCSGCSDDREIEYCEGCDAAYCAECSPNSVNTSSARNVITSDSAESVSSITVRIALMKSLNSVRVVKNSIVPNAVL